MCSKGRTVVTGCVEQGNIKVGEEVELLWLMHVYYLKIKLNILSEIMRTVTFVSHLYFKLEMFFDFLSIFTTGWTCEIR